LLDDDTIGIIIINEDFFRHVDERTRKKIDRIYRPIVVPVPSKKTLSSSEARRDYLASLIRLAIGFDIKLGERE
jgi:V/A-type H+-transporting ATPase subunit F